MEHLAVKRTVAMILLALLIASVYFLPLKIPCNIETPVKIQAVREWTLVTNNAGFLFSTLLDNNAGTTSRIFMTELERGDALTLDIPANIQPGMQVAAGDTVATIVSADIERDIAALERELITQRALLVAAEAGEKISLVTEAEKRLAHARELLAEQERVVSRLGELHRNGYVPYQDYEMALSVADLYRIGVDIATSELQTATSGVRPEDRTVISETIRSIEEELNILRAKLDSFTITVPMNGILLEQLVSDTLIRVADTSAFVAVIPIRLDVEFEVREDMPVSLILPGNVEPVNATIIRIGSTAANTMNEQVVIATAKITDSVTKVYHGEQVMCRIHCDPLTIREYLGRYTGGMF